MNIRNFRVLTMANEFKTGFVECETDMDFNEKEGTKKIEERVRQILQVTFPNENWELQLSASSHSKIDLAEESELRGKKPYTIIFSKFAIVKA